MLLQARQATLRRAHEIMHWRVGRAHLVGLQPTGLSRGDFRNNGREYRPQGNPEEVRVHDFLIKELGRAVPYGIYDLAANSGWVSVSVDHDTAAFAVNSIRQWWRTVGRGRYPEATR